MYGYAVGCMYYDICGIVYVDGCDTCGTMHVVWCMLVVMVYDV